MYNRELEQLEFLLNSFSVSHFLSPNIVVKSGGGSYYRDGHSVRHK